MPTSNDSSGEFQQRVQDLLLGMAAGKAVAIWRSPQGQFVLDYLLDYINLATSSLAPEGYFELFNIIY